MIFEEQTKQIMQELNKPKMLVEQRTEEIVILKAQLQQSRCRFITMLEGIADALFILDNQWKFTYVNAEGEQLFGRESDYYIDKIIWDVFPEIVYTLFYHEYHKAASSKKDVHFEWLTPLSKQWLNVHIYYYEDEIFIILHNINKQKQTEAELLKKEKQFEVSVGNMLDNFAIFTTVRNDAGKTIDFVINYLNSSVVSENSQISKDIQVGKHLLDLFPTYFESNLFIDCCQVVETGKPLIKELISYDKVDGIISKAVEIHVVKLFDGIAACYRNITENKRNEEKLRLYGERFYKVFNKFPIMLCILTFDHRYLHVNESWLKVMGYELNEVIGKTDLELNVWENLQDHARFIDCLVGEIDLKIVELKFQTKTGEIRNGLVSSELIYINHEPCFFIILKDITKRKQWEQEYLRLNRLNLVDKMTASITHEIRNPLTIVNGFLQMLKIKEIDNENTAYFDIMIDELNRANSIITNFLSLAQNQPRELQPMNLNDIINRILDLIRADATMQDISVEFYPQKAPDLALDEKEIRQLILNLCRNGLEAMSYGGKLTISTLVDGNEMVLSIKDQGKGIEPKILLNIGTPFYTTKEQGTGLGLAVCYGIAAKHNAYIDVETCDKGTTFQVHFKLEDSSDKKPA